jgi:hypothetical protein
MLRALLDTVMTQTGGGGQKRSFFRQGACKTNAIELDQVNSIREADTLFSVGAVNQV